MFAINELGEGCSQKDISENGYASKKTVNSTIKKFTSKSRYNTYRGFEIGYSTDKTSSIFPLFLENINKYGNDIFYKAILDSYGFDIQYLRHRYHQHNFCH